MNTKKSKIIPELKAVDFFCCSGGVTCGFKRAGIDVLAGIDIEGDYKDTYEKNNIGSKFITADIAVYQPEQLSAALDIFPYMDDLIFVGCSPCQYYTTIQTDKKKSSRGKLLLEEFVRFVDYFRPGFIFIENVPGLETKPESPLSRFKEHIESIGYSFDEQVINAANYKVPQKRKRYVLIATRLIKDIKITKVKKAAIKVTVRAAIGKLPPISFGHKDGKKDKHWTSNLQDINIKRISKTSKNGGTRLEWKDDPELQLNCYKGKDSSFTDVYGRMFWDLPAPTITTKFYSLSNGRFGHPDQDRAISLKEGAILQSFPLNYRFHSNNIVTIARMIGNAVPPKLAEAIGKNIIKIYKNAAVQNESQGS